jgi:hypothetical protein
MAQLLGVPNLESQRAAMKKLKFLVGEWAGEARVLRGPSETDYRQLIEYVCTSGSVSVSLATKLI